MKIDCADRGRSRLVVIFVFFETSMMWVHAAPMEATHGLSLALTTRMTISETTAFHPNYRCRQREVDIPASYCNTSSSIFFLLSFGYRAIGNAL
jgi:hypothetical protein